jgi:putative GTP pyrophosphokinase
MIDQESEFPQYRTEILVPLAVKLQSHVESCLKGVPRVDRVSTRAKSADRFFQKAMKKQADGSPKYSDPMSQIQDQIGARIVTFYLSDVDVVSAAIDAYFRPIEHQSIVPDSDSEFGYTGKHYILFMPTDLFDAAIPKTRAPRFFELQIKTLFQHAWSEAEHDLAYKPVAELNREQRRKIAFTAAQAWGADLIFNELHVQTSKDVAANSAET